MTTQTSTARTAVVVATAIVGGLVLTGAGASWALAMAQASGGGVESTVEAPAGTSAGLTGLELEAGGADVTVMFGEVAEPLLQTGGPGAGQWTMERDDDELVVRSPARLFDFGSDVCLIWCLGQQNARRATLVLPHEFKQGALDADISLGSGTLFANGGFDDLDLDIGSGEARVEGRARNFQLRMASGDASILLVDVDDADIDISSGRADLELRGTAPSNLGIEISSGDLDVELPNVAYRVDSRVSSGDLRNELRVDPAASNRVQVELSSGTVTLRAGA